MTPLLGRASPARCGPGSGQGPGPLHSAPLTYLDSASAYGTFDQGGNLWEWNETASGLSRGNRGGDWARQYSYTRAMDHYCDDASYEGSISFRLAGSMESTAIPEPAMVSLFGIAVAALLRRRRRQA